MSRVSLLSELVRCKPRALFTLFVSSQTDGIYDIAPLILDQRDDGINSSGPPGPETGPLFNASDFSPFLPDSAKRAASGTSASYCSMIYIVRYLANVIRKIASVKT